MWIKLHDKWSTGGAEPSALLLVNYQQASTMNIQSTRGSGAVVNRFEELAQQGFILYIVLHWSANNSVAAPRRTACSCDYVLLKLKGVAWLAYGCVDRRE